MQVIVKCLLINLITKIRANDRNYLSTSDKARASLKLLPTSDKRVDFLPTSDIWTTYSQSRLVGCAPASHQGALLQNAHDP